MYCNNNNIILLSSHNCYLGVSFRNFVGDRGSPEVVLHNISGDIFDLRSGATVPKSVATSAETRVITTTLNFHNF
jgi:hypothetical protein